MALDPRKALRAGFDYLFHNPRELLRQARHALGLRLAVPLDAVRWLVDHLPVSKSAPKDVVIGTSPPSLTLAATIDLMGTKLRAGAAIRFEEVTLSPEAVRLCLRLRDVTLEPLGSGDSPVAAFLKSGALDLTKPGNIANMLPMRPPALVEAIDDRIVLDLLKVPKLAKNGRFRKILEVMSPLFLLPEMRTEEDHLLITWRPRPSGLSAALGALVS